MRDSYPEVRLRVREGTAIASRGDTVLTTGRDGMLRGEPEQGLFVHQTRLLSHYRILLGGVPPLLAASSNARATIAGSIARVLRRIASISIHSTPLRRSSFGAHRCPPSNDSKRRVAPPAFPPLRRDS